MDLQTVAQNLNKGIYIYYKGKYKDQNEFSKDIRKIWDNSFLYNEKSSEIYQMTTEIKNYFE